MAEILYHGVRLNISAQLSSSSHLRSSVLLVGGSIYTTEISKDYESGLSPPLPYPQFAG